jgi:hypothetical protein
MPICRRKSQILSHLQNLVELQVDGCAGLLGNFVLDGQIEVVGSVEQPFECAFVLG